jgi:hypothetical protein
MARLLSLSRPDMSRGNSMNAGLSAALYLVALLGAAWIVFRGNS